MPGHMQKLDAEYGQNVGNLPPLLPLPCIFLEERNESWNRENKMADTSISSSIFTNKIKDNDQLNIFIR